MFFGRELFLDLFGNDILIGQICFSKAVVDTWNLFVLYFEAEKTLQKKAFFLQSK